MLFLLLFLSALAIAGCTERPTTPTPNPAIQSGTTHIRAAEAPFHELALETPGSGGYYLDQDGSLVLLLMDTTKRSAAASRISVRTADGRLPQGLLSKGVKVRVAQYDFPSLARWRDLVNDAFLGPVAGVVETDADEVLNRVRIGIDLQMYPEAEAEVMRRLPELGVPTEAVRIVQADPVVVNSPSRRGSSPLSVLLANETVAMVPNPLVAGYLARTDAQVQGCTFGPVVWRNGSPAVFTASHCTTVIYGLDPPNSPIKTSDHAIVGLETIDPGPTCGTSPPCRRSDAALFYLQPGVAYRRGAIARTIDITYTWGTAGSLTVDQSNNFRAVLGIWNAGQGLFKTGRLTGTTGGTLIHSCFTSLGADGFKRECSGRAGYYATDGESGAPVWVSDAQEARLYGIHWGNNPGGSPPYSVFSYYSEAVSEMGGTFVGYTDITVSPSVITGTIAAGYPSLSWTAVTVTNSPLPTVYRLRRRTWQASTQSYIEYDYDVVVSQTQFSHVDQDRPVDLNYGGTTPPSNVNWVQYYILATNHGVSSVSNSVYYRRKNLQ